MLVFEMEIGVRGVKRVRLGKIGKAKTFEKHLKIFKN